MASPAIQTNSVSIRSATAEDAASIADIYNHYILNTCATFQTEAITAAEQSRYIEEILSLSLPWLVATDGDAVLGFAYASKWKGRCAYRFAVETTIYLNPNQTHKGIGSTLYTALLDSVKSQSMHTAIGGIALPNDSSVRLHERLGFEKVGTFAEVGYKQQRWVDVEYWQITL